ncbi:AMP-binding protein [Thalassotalea psychrophila]|uniref:AMP-binding protein n=1 Tax=Thalassotalea psychrophila TaxID=3065647 RepID=A0ABY9TYG6_9GAMM|nr:AMP-binding protein [Colwelliaceae bacterium SQ149]
MRVIDFFDQGAALYPDNVAFHDLADSSESTYSQASSVSHKVASALHKRGYVKGSKVGILAPNSNVAFEVLLGAFRAESVWLPINPRNPIDINIDLLTRFDGDLLLYHSNYEKEARAIIAGTPNLKEIVCIDKTDIEGENLESWLVDADDFHQMGDEQNDDVAAIFPTGGTTGKSKGVIMSHKAIEAMFTNFYSHFNYYDNTCHLVVAPMTHSAGLIGALHFARGGKNVMMAAADPEGIMQVIEQQKITHFFLPPTVMYMMLAHENVGKYDYSSLQHFLVGAAPTSLTKLKEAIKVFGPVMTEAFGQSEAPAAICAKAPWDYMDSKGNIIDSRLASVGRPCVMNQVAIMDDDGNKLPKGQAGEICVKGNLVNPGYYKNEAATAEAQINGWLHTGDVGVMDDDGYITIVDRKKDMIITGGFNVFPNEIEQIISAHSAVQDCAVIGIPDEKWGEAVKAVVQLKPGHELTDVELATIVKQELGSVKTPKSIDFVSDLPRSPVGKVLKADIRKQYWGDKARAVN